MKDMDAKAVRAAQDKRLMEEFFRENERFILRCASFFLHRYISKSDDEWSVASLAFSQAVRNYSAQKGSFLSFAQLVIRRGLTDYLRSQSRFHAEISVKPSVLDLQKDEEDCEEGINREVKVQIYRNTGETDVSLKSEIEAVNQLFAAYGFSFYDLIKYSPKAKKTKKACAKAAACLIQNPVLLHEMRNSKTLPLKIIEKNTGVPRKILERHRKYIIAATEIITGDYPCLAEYMRYIREELKK